MFIQKICSLTKRLEDPNHPLLGPTLKGLYFFGLRQSGSKLRTTVYNIFHYATFIFVASEIVEIYRMRNDLNMVLTSTSLTVLGIVCSSKCYSFVMYQNEWGNLFQEISIEELRQLSRRNRTTTKLMDEYKKYTRHLTYLYWTLVFLTIFFLIASPFLKYVSSNTYREDIRTGKEPLPQILSSWLPFDNTRMPGYLVGVCLHILMGSQGSGIIATFDMNTIAIMSYLKGQMSILRENCKTIFQEETAVRDLVLERIRECHRHHNILLRHYHMLDALLSTVMFNYVLLCSVTICCSVVQFTSKEATTTQKFCVMQYCTALISQLFVYCWHSNEVGMETKDLDSGVYQSDWWKGDVKLRRQMLLLSGKLNETLFLNAGPYIKLSVPTFIDVMKGSYSFFTLISQMQDHN